MAAEAAIQLVVFDIGGVMIHLAGGWESACRCAGIDYRPFQFTPEQRAAFLQLEDAYESGRLGTEDFSKQLHHVLDGLYAPAEIEAMYLAVIQAEVAGIYALVQAIKASGRRTACLSNTCALHWPRLTDPAIYPGIASLDYQHASHLIGVRKPDDLIYRRFEELTGFAGPQILFFDDREDNVRAAQACGWHGELISSERSSAEQIGEALRRFGIVEG